MTLVLVVPGFGDDVQTIKAGFMEVADIFVLNKVIARARIAWNARYAQCNRWPFDLINGPRRLSRPWPLTAKGFPNSPPRL